MARCLNLLNLFPASVCKENRNPSKLLQMGLDRLGLKLIQLHEFETLHPGNNSLLPGAPHSPTTLWVRVPG